MTLVAGLCMATPAAFAQDLDALRFFESKIRPVLATKCYACHSIDAKNPFANLRLDSRAGLLKGGLSGPAIVPGDPSASTLIEAVRYESNHLRMPPTGKLGDADIEALATWVENGAVWPEGDEAAVATTETVEDGDDEQENHWAFQPVKRTDPPLVGDDDWPLVDLDRFVLKRLEEEGLSPAPDASRYEWLRRVTFDLTGLPPTLDEVEEFVGDGSPQAYAAVVDRLLASPGFGERWGRHWLDLTGYADNIGLGRRIPAREPWRYRDYVINAYNSDRPFNEFVREQVAGDVLEYSDDLDRREKLIATGFLAIGPWALVNSDKEQLRMDVVDHQIDTVGRALLGLTLGCARCHDHKFDPVSTREYYAMAGIFGSTATLDGRIGGVFSDVHRTPLPETPEELHERARALDAWQRDHAEAKRRHAAAVAVVDELKAKEAGKETLQAANKEAAARKKELALVAYLKPKPPMALTLRDLDVPEDARINLGGNPHMLGDTAPRGFLAIATVGEPPRIANRYTFEGSPRASSGRRELAQWLIDEKNPLLARVQVNRLWRHLFGEGLVRSVDNFGVRGEAPSHPNLLDSLAARFVEQGWSVKTMLRELALSRTYRMGSAQNEAAMEKDPDNRLLWRANRRRLEAEAFRDAVLAVAGTLDRTRGGFTMPVEIPDNVRLASPPFLTARARLGDRRRFRRTVYLPTLRKAQMDELDVLDLFDFPDPNTTTGDRETTTVPTQALFLMSSPFLQEQSRYAAQALLERKTDDGARVRSFTLRALGRPAAEGEVAAALGFIRTMESELGRDAAWSRWCQAIFISNEFLFRS